MEIREKVYGFKTKHKEGFTLTDIEELLQDYPNMNRDRFDDALMGDTCLVIDDEIVRYHHDVELALRCGVENRKPRSWEWD